jgi:hypothetical protein
MSSEKTEPSTTNTEPCVSTFSYLTEEEKKIDDDYEWCLHDPEVRRQHGGQVVVAHQRRIWGAGKDHRAALDAAIQQPDCPHPRVCAFVVVPYLISTPADPSPAKA